MSALEWLQFAPTLPEGSLAEKVFRKFAKDLSALLSKEDDPERNSLIELCRRRAVQDKPRCEASARQLFVSAVQVLSDLSKQGWEIRVRGGKIKLSRPNAEEAEEEEPRNDACSTATSLKERVRTQLHAERDEQLRQPATVAFVKEMETRRVFDDQFVSIFSLMRDGRELTEKLAHIPKLPGAEQVEMFRNVVKPYLRFVQEEERCPWTGFRLQDVWRYFRHTWANPYKSVPGRTMLVLVRDAAAPFHPVIGIAALSSAAVAVTVRDERIGWTREKVLEEIREKPSAKFARWMVRVVEEAIDEIFKVDFLEDELLTVQELASPTRSSISRFEKEGKKRKKDHFRFMQSKEYKKVESAKDLSEDHWVEQARSHLFRSKRAYELARMLSVRMVLQRFFKEKPTKAELIALTKDRAGREVLSKIVRKAKADRVGTAIADISVCGAIPPYNEILGGKLIAMLMTSPEVILEYRRRYGKLPSVIASSMAGQAVTRAADLVFGFCTR
jgi:hypothetical protein